MKEFFRLTVRAWGLLAAAGWLGCLFTATAFLGQLWWAFDLTSHFRVQYAAGLFLLAAIACVARQWKTFILFAGFAVINCAVVIPYCCAGCTPAVVSAKQTLRVLLLNVHTGNHRYDLVETFIREANPDLVVLEEVNEEWLRKLAGLRADYPYSMQESREDNFGIALLSKVPLAQCEIVYLGEAELPSVTAVAQIGGKSLKILGTHPLPPFGRENSRLRNQQLESISGFLAAWRGPVVILGDLNTTPWSGHFQKLLHDTGLVDSGRGGGFLTTWPSRIYPLRIEIDHCLLSRDLKVISKRVGANVGSDHLPLVVEINLE